MSKEKWLLDYENDLYCADSINWRPYTLDGKKVKACILDAPFQTLCDGTWIENGYSGDAVILEESGEFNIVNAKMLIICE